MENVMCMVCGCYEHCHEEEGPTKDGQGVGRVKVCEHCDGDRPCCHGSEANIGDAIEQDYRNALTFYPHLPACEEIREGLVGYGLINWFTHEWTDLGARVATSMLERACHQLQDQRIDDLSEAVTGPIDREQLMVKAVPGCRYRHRKGGEYLVTGIAEHTETGEEMVVYRRELDKLYVRPRVMFEDGRFEKIGARSHSMRFGTNWIPDLGISGLSRNALRMRLIGFLVLPSMVTREEAIEALAELSDRERLERDAGLPI